MKNLTLLIIIALLFSSCAPSSLQVEQNGELVLQHDSKVYTLGSSGDSNLLRFVNLAITQSSIKSTSNATLFYEQIIVDQAYEFSRGSVETLKIIFDLSKSNVVYGSGTILLVQLQVNRDAYVNIMAEISATQDMSYIYGYSNEEYLSMAKELGLELDSSSLRKVLRPKASITKWNQTRLIIEPILQPFDKRSII